MGTLRSIQYLRAFAALMVATYHALQWSRIEFVIGAAGVDVFFVISGFIMWRTTEGTGIRPLTFLRRRAARIAPLYWTVTLGLAAAALLWPAKLPEIDVTWDHLLASLAFLQHRNPDGQPFPILTLGWTLNYEAVFYLLFAIALALPPGRRLIAIAFALTTAAVGGFFYPPAYEMIANPLLLEFLAGVLWAKALGQWGGPGRTAGWTMFGAGLGAYVLMFALQSEWDLWRPLFWGFPAFLLVAGLTSVEADGGVADWPWLKALGDASYSLYLLHPIVLGILAVVMGTWIPWLYVPLGLATSCAVAWLVWKLFEIPTNRLLSGRLPDAAAPSHSGP